MKIRRKKDGQFIKEFKETPGYRHITMTVGISEAADFSEEECQKICDFDFFGIPYNNLKSGTTSGAGDPEFERWRL